MEHRWGRRKRVILRTRMSRPGHTSVGGWLTDISLSGAFLRTTDALPGLGPIIIRMDRRSDSETGVEELQLPGRVVRQDPSGVGIEWDEFGSATVAEFVRRAASTDPQGIHLTQETAASPGPWMIQIRDTPDDTLIGIHP